MRCTLISISFIILLSVFPQHAEAESFDAYVQKLEAHPQVGSILAEGLAHQSMAEGEMGLPDPVFMIGVDNVPFSDPEFDRFLPSAKVIGFNQEIPNRGLREAKAKKWQQMSKKQSLIAHYTKARLRYMLIVKLAEYDSIKTQKRHIKNQLAHYRELENSFKGQIESGRSVYQRFSEVDVERAEAERKLNNLDAKQAMIEAAFVRLVEDVPDVKTPEVKNIVWDENADRLYPVMIAAEDIQIAQKDIGVADAAFLPNFGINAVYKQREDVGNVSGDDWFSVQAQVSIPLWSSKNQKPKLNAAKYRERSAVLRHQDMKGLWIKKMTALKTARDAAAKNIKVLKSKSWAMKKKIDAAQRNYESGSDNLDTILLAKIDRLNIKSRLAQTMADHAAKAAEFEAHIAPISKGEQE